MTTTESLALVLDNDRASFEQCIAFAEKARFTATGCVEVRAGDWTMEEAVRFHLADYLKDWVESLTDDAGAGLSEPASLIVAQLFQHALEKVNWAELARHYLRKATAHGA